MKDNNVPYSDQEANKKIQSNNPLEGVLDKTGQGLGTVLSPLGAVVGTVTKPVVGAVGGATHPFLSPVAGDRDEKMEVLGGKKLDSYEHGKDSLGGQVQDSENPLGLDQTGKFGFRDE